MSLIKTRFSTKLRMNSSCKLTFCKSVQLEKVYNALDKLTSFLHPVLPMLNSHLTEFYTMKYWQNKLHKSLRADLESKSVEEVRQCVRDLVQGAWRHYPVSTSPSNFLAINSLEELIVIVGRLQLAEMQLSIPLSELTVNSTPLYPSENKLEENLLKLDAIMSPKKTHEVELMSELILRISNSKGLFTDHFHSNIALPENFKNIEQLVDVGSGKGYLSSYLTLLHRFKVLAIDCSPVNSDGCEKRSARLEKVWAQLVRRAVERQLHGECSKRGKHWKGKKRKNLIRGAGGCGNGSCDEKESGYLVPANDDYSSGGVKGDRCSSPNGCSANESNFQRPNEGSSNSSANNERLKTLTQFVEPEFDFSASIRENFSSDSGDDEGSNVNQFFGIVGLHTCGNLGADSLRLFANNECAKFICNVPCCYHLVDENHTFYPSSQFLGSKTLQKDPGHGESLANAILKPRFPLCRKLDVDTNRFCLGRNARMMSAYSVHRMVDIRQGLELHPSIFRRCLLQLLIKKKLKENYSEMDDSPYQVGKIGDKCSTFGEYVEKGLANLRLEEKIQVSEEEIQELHQEFSSTEKENLHKFYLVRSIFASLVESVILLDRIAFLLEQDAVSEAHLVQLFNPAVSPRAHAIVAIK